MEYANKIGYSDIEPAEVVRKVSDKCLVIRAMDAERDQSVKLDFQAGGFSAVCVNQNQQRWNVKSNSANREVRIRLQKNGDWKCSGGNRYALSDKPVKFYDYNF